ncbi:transglutaminase [Oleiphilus messinensis]|uniref:Transglutaminase n=1 Tax=Oleiphilus messinensis TaxID=141451 RepID=A0A1Y0I5Z3_9GAMM|nr:transglutaminase-like domain-containing protein [Oleiphilus messinensis]ARU55216.1 transglutaminase [Oleiphilus messinensis]
MQKYLEATSFFDFDKPAVQQWADKQLHDCDTHPVAIAQCLYLACRDQIRYNPYTAKRDRAAMSASYLLDSGESYCIPKAVLLGAVARYKGIPSRLGFANVRNHLSSPKLIEWLGTDVFHMHGYTELYLTDRWVKATPAFDARLCRFMKVEPLPFDGVHDSVFQEYTADGLAHMEYLADHGLFADLPFDFIWNDLERAYPHLFSGNQNPLPQRSLELDLSDSEP